MSVLRLARISPTVSTVRHASRIVIPSTLHNQEVQFFEKMSDEWWDKDGKMHLLMSMNGVRIPIIQNFLTNAGLAHVAYSETKTPLRGIKMLDVGCGGGYVSEALAKLGADVTGVDAGNDLIQIAKTHMATDTQLQKHLRYELSLIEDFSQSHRESFDAIVSSEVIEHVNEPEMFVKHCVECLKPGGSIIFTTMDRTPPGGFLNITFNEHVYKVMPKGTHRYEQFIRPKELKNILHKYDCKSINVQGFTLNPFTGVWFKMPVSWFNYALHAVKGGMSNQGVCKFAGMYQGTH